MKPVVPIIISVIIIIAVSFFLYSKINITNTQVQVKFKKEDLNSIVEIATTQHFEIIPNQIIEKVIEKEDEQNYNRSDLVKGTNTGWYYEIKDGNMDVKSQVKDGKYHGKFWSFYQNGNMRSAGKYQNGNKEELWVQFFDNGEQMNYGKWEDGIEIGEWLYFDTLGYLLEKRNYSGTKGTYNFNQVDSLGNLTNKGSFLNGKRNGEWSYFKKNEKIYEKRNYLNGRQHGKHEEWTENGIHIVGNYENGKKHGIVKCYNKENELFQILEFEKDSLIRNEKIKN